MKTKESILWNIPWDKEQKGVVPTEVIYEAMRVYGEQMYNKAIDDAVLAISELGHAYDLQESYPFAVKEKLESLKKETQKPPSSK